MKKLIIILIITFTSSVANAQYSMGKSFMEVHKQYEKLKGSNLNQFIEIEEETPTSNLRLSYGYKNDSSKQTIYFFSCEFNKNQVCFMETWSAFKTKEEAMSTLREYIGKNSLKYIKSNTQNNFDEYILDTGQKFLSVYLSYGDIGFKEYLLTFVDTSLKD